MKKLSLWISSAASLFMLVLVVIGIVKVSMATGKFDFGGYFAYQNEKICGSVLHKIVLVLIGISLITFLTFFIKECSIFQKVLMIVFLTILTIAFAILYVMDMKKTTLIIFVIAIGLVPIFTILSDEEFRYKFISFVLMSLWAGFGLYFLLIFVGLVVLYGVFLLVASIVEMFTNFDCSNLIDHTGETITRVFLYR